MNNPVSRSTIEAIAQISREPSWLTDIRLEAWETYESYCGANTRAFDQVQAFMEPPQASVPSHQWPRDLKYVIEERGDEEGLIIQRDSTVLSRSVTKEQSKRGVIFTDLHSALRSLPGLVKRSFALQIKSQDRYAALNTAFWCGGTFLFVPAHVDVKLPFHTCYWMTTPGSAVLPRTLIVAERGSRVTFVDDFLSIDWDEPALAVSAIELFVQGEARVTYQQIHHWGRGVRHENRQMSSVAASGELESTQIKDSRPMITLERAAELYPEVRA